VTAGALPYARRMSLAPLPEGFAETREALHRVATHVLARRRHSLSGRFGLRAAPGGIASPAAGPEHEALRTSGAWLVRERTGEHAGTTVLDLRTASLADAAAFADVDLDAPFSAGDDTPALGDVGAPLAIEPASAGALAEWFALGWSVIDAAVAGTGPAAEASVLQLWPEHFDAGCDLAVGAGRRTNLGASPGDGFHPEPYLYVGPWDPDRPGDAAYWNAPFGAILGHTALCLADDPVAAGLAFVQEGLERLAPDHTG